MAERHFLIKTMALFIEQLMDDAAKVIENREIYATLYSLRPLVEKSVSLALVNHSIYNQPYEDPALRRVELQVTHHRGRITCQFLVTDVDWQDYYHRVVTLLEGLLVSHAAFRDGAPMMLGQVVKVLDTDFSSMEFTERHQLLVKRGDVGHMFHIV